MKIRKTDEVPGLPWELTLPSGSTAHFIDRERAEQYRDWLTENEREYWLTLTENEREEGPPDEA